MKKLGFDFSHLKGDLLGGLTAGIVALPLALAFGLQSGMGAAAGLYGAIFIGIFAALFGGTATQISGPTAPMTAVSMLIIAGLVSANDGDLQKALPAIIAVFALAGIFQIGLGLLKVGKYIRYIPYPVISGFMTGIGVIIIITQLLPVIGYRAHEDPAFVDTFKPKAEQVLLEQILEDEVAKNILVLEDFENTIKRAPEITAEAIQKTSATLAKSEASGVLGALKVIPLALKNISYLDLIMALLTIAIIFGFKRITTAVPSTLVALLSVSLGAYFFAGEYRTIGEIPSSFPSLHLEVITGFKFSNLKPYIFTALSLAVLGALDSLLTSIVADNMTKTKHAPNQELVGQGIGNVAAALFGGLPGAGATIRTVVNINSGARTKLSGIVASVVLLVVLLALAPLASRIPAAVLAGILVTVGIGVIDKKGLRHLRQLPLAEIVVMLTVLGLTVFVGLIEAVAVGSLLSCVLFMKHIADVIDHQSTSGPLEEPIDEEQWQGEEGVEKRFGKKVMIKHLDGPLFFGFASRFQERVAAVKDVEAVIIRMEKVPYVDQTGIYAMEDAILDLQSRGILVAFTGIGGQPHTLFENFGLIPQLVPESLCFDEFQSSLQAVDEALSKKPEAKTP